MPQLVCYRRPALTEPGVSWPMTQSALTSSGLLQTTVRRCTRWHTVMGRRCTVVMQPILLFAAAAPIYTHTHTQTHVHAHKCRTKRLLECGFALSGHNNKRCWAPFCAGCKAVSFGRVSRAIDPRPALCTHTHEARSPHTKVLQGTGHWIRQPNSLSGRNAWELKTNTWAVRLSATGMTGQNTHTYTHFARETKEPTTQKPSVDDT